MKLVLLFFCVLIIILLMIVFSSVKLNIKKCKISNFEGNVKHKLDKDVLIYIEFYFLGLIKITRIRVTKRLFERFNIKDDIKKVEREPNVIKKIHPIEIIKKLKIKVEKLYIDLSIGIDDVIITSYLVALISSIIRNSYGTGKS